MRELSRDLERIRKHKLNSETFRLYFYNLTRYQSRQLRSSIKTHEVDNTVINKNSRIIKQDLEFICICEFRLSFNKNTAIEVDL